MTNARYRLYREHKFVSFMLSSFSAEIAKIDFSLDDNVNHIKEKLSGIIKLLHGHASHENISIHALLKNKGSCIHEKIEAEHSSHSNIFEKLNQLLTEVIKSTDIARRVELGHQFYLGVQRFEAENLLHQIYEETVIMPELQRLYTDEELLVGIEAKTYELMTSEQMIHMMEVLFPHFNMDDREAFLRDIYQSQPAKFVEAWAGIAPMIDSRERDRLITCLGIQ